MQRYRVDPQMKRGNTMLTNASYLSVFLF